jgi:hypothetical protein
MRKITKSILMLGIRPKKLSRGYIEMPKEINININNIKETKERINQMKKTIAFRKEREINLLKVVKKPHKDIGPILRAAKKPKLE